MTKTIVWRVQPIGAKLHGIRTTTSNDNQQNGVHVFEHCNALYAGVYEWCENPCYNHGCEVVQIECDLCDLRANGDYEGSLLIRGRGRIVRRKKFANLRAVAKWAERSCNKWDERNQG